MPKWGGSAFPQHPGLSPPGDARLGQVLHTSLCPGAVPRCNPPPQSMSPVLSAFPEASSPPWLLRRRGPPPARVALSRNPDAGGRELLSGFFTTVSSRHSRGDSFSSSRKRAAAGHHYPSRLQGGPGGCWAPAGPASVAPGGSGPAGARLPALLGQRMQKAGVCCRHRFPFMALLLPSLEVGDW